MQDVKENIAEKWLWGCIAGIVLIALPFFLEKVLTEYHLYLANKILVWALFATSFSFIFRFKETSFCSSSHLLEPVSNQISCTVQIVLFPSFFEAFNMFSKRHIEWKL